MKRILMVLSIVTIFTLALVAQQEARLMRFPSIHGNQVVFSYAGDLYSVARTGGLARKLTNHIGYEMFAKFSPDGKTIAFSAQYDGNTEVYTMPSHGGVPKRLTYTSTLSRDDISDRMGPNNIVMAWTPDGKNIVYRSRKQSYNDFVGQLFQVSANGGLSTELPLSTGGFCSFSGDGSKLVFNRVFREFRTWKYYKGGMADDIWVYDYATKKSARLFENIAQDIFPMWHGDNIYFISDRDRIMNLFVFNTISKEIKKVTNFNTYDIKFPSLGKDEIIFENGGFIYVFDIKTQKSEKINIQIADDFLPGRNELKDASKNINSVSLSPDGKRLVIGARGDIFSVPVANGITRNLTQTSGVHERDAVWSPDGKNIAYVSDQSGEYEIYMVSQDGSEKSVQLTKNADTYKYYIEWSPDSKKILWSDKKLRLQFVDIETQKVTLIEQSKVGEFNQFSWSGDSKWITYVRPEQNAMSRIMLYSLDSKISTEITDGFFASNSPVFSQDNKYLLFTSKRDFNPIYSETEWNHAYRDMTRIYIITLQKSTLNPIIPENDEVEIKVETKPTADKKPEKEKTTEAVKTVDLKIDLDGIQDRIIGLPIKSANYWNIVCVNDKVYYNVSEIGGNGTTIKMFDLKTRKEIELGLNMSFEISFNAKKMLVTQGKKYSVIELPTNKINLETFVDLSGLKMWVNNKEEWKQIYDESWRQMRDFFYVENMHGVNWKDMHTKYEVLVPYVNNRNDLNYVIGELIGELNVGHAYVNGGDCPAPERLSQGLLGAKLSRHSSGYFQIDKILSGENWNKKLYSPLTEIGVGVPEGNFILAVNGQSTKDMNDIYLSLVNTAGKQVELIIGTTPDLLNTRKVYVTPTANESDLYYLNWVKANIEKVNQATKGEVGYIHVPNMVTEGLNEFVKYFYPQLTKKALIIDDRGNGGGNVSPMLIERLNREITRANMARNVETPSQTPRQMMLGPKVMLVNQYSASDGDLFPYAFKKHGMGKVIGVKTWGGVVGIRGSLPFIDGADLRKPEFASYSSDESKWIIEGEGVEPDIYIDNNPSREYLGLDDQLDKAIEVILQELKNYKPIPDIPKGPDKSR